MTDRPPQPDSAPPPVLELRGVSKSFGATRALTAVDLAVRAGETLALIGPSGCGKSTTLQLMIALLAPDAGSVCFEGEEVTLRRAEAVRRRMGYVIQSGGLFPHLSARGNVALQARYFGWDAGRVEQRLAELAELTRFPGAGLDRYPAQLSGGQRQRVGLMRALMLDPDVLLLDEPLGALDPIIRSELQEDLRRIFRTLGKTVVLVTHDLAEARYLGDRIVLLHEGRVVQEGVYENLAERPAAPFVTRFINAQRTLPPPEERA